MCGMVGMCQNKFYGGGELLHYFRQNIGGGEHIFMRKLYDRVLAYSKTLQRQKTSSVRLIEDYRCLTIGAQAIRHLIINVLNLHIYCLSYNNLHSTNSQRTYRYSREEESVTLSAMYDYVCLCITMYGYV